jgi:hypothetical protein
MPHRTMPKLSAPPIKDQDRLSVETIYPPINGRDITVGFMDIYLITYLLATRKEGEWRDRERERVE